MFPSLNLLLCITRIFFKIEETVVSRLPVNVQASSCQRFVVYEAGRVFDKQQILKSLQNESIEPLTQTIDNRIQNVSFSNRGSFSNISGEQPAHSLRSSIWKLNNDRWKMIFHQGTLVRESSVRYDK